MVIQPITAQYYQPLIELYLELERFYFKDQAIDSRERIEDYIVNKMLAPLKAKPCSASPPSAYYFQPHALPGNSL